MIIWVATDDPERAVCLYESRDAADVVPMDAIPALERADMRAPLPSYPLAKFLEELGQPGSLEKIVAAATAAGLSLDVTRHTGVENEAVLRRKIAGLKD